MNLKMCCIYLWRWWGIYTYNNIKLMLKFELKNEKERKYLSHVCKCI